MLAFAVADPQHARDMLALTDATVRSSRAGSAAAC
jgi:hypothetical protein